MVLTFIATQTTHKYNYISSYAKEEWFMGQQQVAHLRSEESLEQFFSLCEKIDQVFLKAACEWLGNLFGADEVSLISIFPNNHFFENSSQKKQTNAIEQWQRPSPISCLPSVDYSEKQYRKEEKHSFYPGNPARFVSSSEDNPQATSIEYRNYAAEPHEGFSERRLSISSTDDWPHETYYLLNWLEPGAKSVSNGSPSQDDNFSSVHVSTILKRTAVELSRLIYRKQKEDEIAAFYTIISSIPDSVFAKDRSLKYCLINDAFCRLFGKSREEILGKTDEDLFRHQQAGSNEEIDQRVLRGETVRQEKTVELHHSLRSFREIDAPVRNETGSVIGLCGITHDISDLKEIELQLKQANSFQEAVIKTAAEGIGVCVPISQEPKLRFTIWNDQLKKLTGYSLEEINQFDWVRNGIRHRLGPEFILKRIDQLIQGEQFQEEEFEVISKQGEKKKVLVSSSQVSNGNEHSAIVLLIHDITVRSRFRESLEESQRRYHLATRNAKISVWEWNLITNTVDDDGNLSRILGYPQQAFTSIKTWMQYIHPDDIDHTQRRYEEFIRGDTEKLFLEKRMKHAKGHWVWIATHGSYISSNNSSRVVIGTDLDITDQKETADRLAALQKDLLQITRLSAVGEIAASLAHDITQPVTAICNYAAAARHLLSMSEQSIHHTTVAGFLKKIEQSSKTATNVLKGIRSYIHEAEGEHSPQTLGQIVDDVLEVAHSDIRHRNIHLNRLNDGDDISVCVDRAQLIHVFLNIINNAFEALSSDSTNKPVITIRTSSERNHGVISIEDNGPGFTQEQVQTIFKPFYSTKKGGMGLGLAICKTLVESNAGSITTEVHPGQGAALIIRLPRKRSDS